MTNNVDTPHLQECLFGVACDAEMSPEVAVSIKVPPAGYASTSTARAIFSAIRL